MLLFDGLTVPAALICEDVSARIMLNDMDIKRCHHDEMKPSASLSQNMQIASKLCQIFKCKIHLGIWK